MDKIILQAHELFKDAGFNYAICGGFALEMCAGKKYREHGDFDMSFFEDERQKVLQFLHSNGWKLYARYVDFADRKKYLANHLLHLVEDPGDAKWDDCENFAAVLPDSYAKAHFVERAGVYTFAFDEPRLTKLDFIKVSFRKRQGESFMAAKTPLHMDKAILHSNGVPYMAPEFMLYLRTPEFCSWHPLQKPKTEADFNTIIPLLSAEQKDWLKAIIKTAYPGGAPWLDGILEGGIQ
ncbi:MAG: hypothetical protein FWE21_06780 [Defluviitaleaceae bacterium]|nr:hypothetical protein [Defluviitaleaceae bacterium]